MARWVFLADPTDYGWAELVRDGRAVWDGIGNAVAQKHLRAARPGDEVLIYHTAPDKAAVGTARVAGEARPDPAEPGRVVVDIEPVSALRRRVPLAELKADGVLSGMGFIRMPRVAVQPLTDEQWDALMRASGTDLATSVGVDPREAGGP